MEPPSGGNKMSQTSTLETYDMSPRRDYQVCLLGVLVLVHGSAVSWDARNSTQPQTHPQPPPPPPITHTHTPIPSCAIHTRHATILNTHTRTAPQTGFHSSQLPTTSSPFSTLGAADFYSELDAMPSAMPRTATLNGTYGNASGLHPRSRSVPDRRNHQPLSTSASGPVPAANAGGNGEPALASSWSSLPRSRSKRLSSDAFTFEDCGADLFAPPAKRSSSFTGAPTDAGLLGLHQLHGGLDIGSPPQF